MSADQAQAARAKIDHRATVTAARFQLALPPRDAREVIVYLVLAAITAGRIVISIGTSIWFQSRRLWAPLLIPVSVWFCIFYAPVAANIFFGPNEERGRLAVLFADTAFAYGEALLRGGRAIWAENAPEMRYWAEWSWTLIWIMLIVWTIWLIAQIFETRDRRRDWRIAPSRGPAAEGVISEMTQQEALAHLLADTIDGFDDIVRAAGRLAGVRLLSVSFVLARVVVLILAVAFWWVLFFLACSAWLAWWPADWNALDLLLYYLWQTTNAGLFGLLELFDLRFGPIGSVPFAPRLLQYVLVLAVISGVAGSIFYSFKLDLRPARARIMKRLEDFEAAGPNA